MLRTLRASPAGHVCGTCCKSDHVEGSSDKTSLSRPISNSFETSGSGYVIANRRRRDCHEAVESCILIDLCTRRAVRTGKRVSMQTSGTRGRPLRANSGVCVDVSCCRQLGLPHDQRIHFDELKNAPTTVLRQERHCLAACWRIVGNVS